MDQDRVGAGEAIGLGPLQRLVHAPAGDQRLDPRHDREVLVVLRVLARLALAAERVDVGQRLALAADEAVGLRELLVLDADAGDAALLELPDQAPQVVEVAVAGIAVEQDRQVARVRHELERVDDLGPARLVVVAHAVLRGDREAQMPLKPASRTMRADRPLCASITNSSWSLSSICRSCALRDSGT